ncbi:hypothetical protein BKI52_02250 [marine bacterium AO1-C]|nr:hypothetical protein BKI52_02250 [marine bacterium AO1-C]
MIDNFENALKGGHPNSLGNTIAVVEAILADHTRFDELFQCYFSEDEVVRLRVSNAMKRLTKAKKSLLIPYIDALLEQIAQIDQASTQWTLANLFDFLSKDLSDSQHTKAQEIMQHNLANHTDWIVLKNSMDTLGKWAKKDKDLENWLRPHLEKLKNDSRKSVASRATKLLDKLS